MKFAIFLVISFFATANSIHAQTERPSGGVGVSPYVQPAEATYRLLFGGGANAGLGLESPQAMIGIVTYQREDNVFSAGLIVSNPVSGGFPRRTYTEFDLLYGLAVDNVFLRYARPSNQFHASISTGISVNNLSTRWRQFGGRHFIDTASYLGPPNSSQIVIGLPVQLQAVYEPFRFAGIGVLLFYDLSVLQPSYGATVMLELRY